MKKNNYKIPEIKVVDLQSEGTTCDFIPVSGPVEADVKLDKNWELEEELEYWEEQSQKQNQKGWFN